MEINRIFYDPRIFSINYFLKINWGGERVILAGVMLTPFQTRSARDQSRTARIQTGRITQCNRATQTNACAVGTYHSSLSSPSKHTLFAACDSCATQDKHEDACAVREYHFFLPLKHYAPRMRQTVQHENACVVMHISWISSLTNTRNLQSTKVDIFANKQIRHLL